MKATKTTVRALPLTPAMLLAIATQRAVARAIDWLDDVAVEFIDVKANARARLR